MPPLQFLVVPLADMALFGLFVGLALVDRQRPQHHKRYMLLASIALLDALQAAELPIIEVHLSNIFRRETYRQHSYVSQAAKGVICGLGPKGYELALEAMAESLAGTNRG